MPTTARGLTAFHEATRLEKRVDCSYGFLRSRNEGSNPADATEESKSAVFLWPAAIGPTFRRWKRDLTILSLHLSRSERNIGAIG
jgi:hypothetical protein